MTRHLAIFDKLSAKLILNGHKKIESRFSKSKLPPFGSISCGDIVYIKPAGQEPVGQFVVKKVIFYDGLTNDDLGQIKSGYGSAIAASESYWQSKMNAKYGSLIFIGEVNQFITSPVKFAKKDLRGWVVIGPG